MATPLWFSNSPFAEDPANQKITFSCLPPQIQAAILHPEEDIYALLRALSYLMYYEVPSSLLHLVENVDVNEDDEKVNARLQGVDRLFLAKYVKDFQTMMELDADVRMLHAAKRGKLEWLVYLHANGCPWDVMVCREAATHGHLACLKYLHANGCPWDDHVPKLAADGNHMDCLVYALDEMCDVHRYVIWPVDAATGICNEEACRMVEQMVPGYEAYFHLPQRNLPRLNFALTRLQPNVI